MSLIDEARALIERSAANVLEEDHTVRDYEDVEDENLAIGEEAIALLQKIVAEDDEVTRIIAAVRAATGVEAGQ